MPVAAVVGRGSGIPKRDRNKDRDGDVDGQTGGSVGVARVPNAGHFPEDEEDDLPELATLLEGRDRRTVVTGARRGNGEQEVQRLPRTTAVFHPSAKAQESNTEPSQDVISTHPSRAIPPMLGSSSNLVLRPTPALHPTHTTYKPPPTATARENASTTIKVSSQQTQNRKWVGKTEKPAPSVKASTVKPRKNNPKKNTGLEFDSSASKVSSGPTITNNRPFQLTRVKPPALPRDGAALEPGDSDDGDGDSDDDGKEHLIHSNSSRTGNSKTVGRKRLGATAARRAAKARSAMFVLDEAVCEDDDEEDDDDLDDDEYFTDLSGFIVDDDISSHHSETDSESDRLARKRSPGVRKRPVRSLRDDRREPGIDIDDRLRSLSLQDHESKNRASRTDQPTVADAVAGTVVTDRDREHNIYRSQRGGVEVVDLTSSPSKPRMASYFQGDNDNNKKADNMPKRRRSPKPMGQQLRAHQHQAWPSSSQSDLADNDEKAATRFTLPIPSRRSPSKVDRKAQANPIAHANLDVLRNRAPDSNIPSTPPQTPPASPSKPRSPSKLNSPSKNLLLSPSKRVAQIPQSPHRQSIDTFWSSEVINEWNDQYSPTKSILTVSPKKRWKIWDEEDDSGVESPSESPARRMGSPTKGSASPTKASQTGNKRAIAVAAKKKFDEQKAGLAMDLLKELDELVSNGRLAQLSQSTGGVKIIWSKNLRSTAGRANWRRTVAKDLNLGAELKGDKGAAGVAKVHHYATIELAEKVIDNEERLVNTLAHEYCHLANFMVSGVRDQPHGASFKRWAQKVTSTFQTHERDIYRRVEVTTKHNYEINHKYLWVCIGTPSNAAKDFLNLPDEDGCGAEYGRHSKSIDVEKHRCGKCKGVLAQVRPKPRKVDQTKKGRSTFKKRGDPLEQLKEAMELVTIVEG